MKLPSTPTWQIYPTTKICKHCDHFEDNHCIAEQNIKDVNLVSGALMFDSTPTALRANVEKCGPDAAWFKRRLFYKIEFRIAMILLFTYWWSSIFQ